MKYEARGTVTDETELDPTQTLNPTHHFNDLFRCIHGLWCHDPSNSVPINVFEAAKKGNGTDLSHWLSSHKVNPNARNWNGNGRAMLHEAAASGHVHIVTELLTQHHVNIDIRSMLGGETALHCAVASNHRGVIHELLKYGANPNSQNKQGLSPLHYAQEKSIVQMLCRYGARIDAKDKNQRTPADTIAMKLGYDDEMVKCLKRIEEEKVVKNQSFIKLPLSRKQK